MRAEMMAQSRLLGKVVAPPIMLTCVTFCSVALAVPPEIAPPSINASGGNASDSVVTALGTAHSRTQSSIATDRLNVKFCGAALDGQTDDASAIDACLASMVPGQTLYFPPGGIDLSRSPISPNGIMAFELSGNTYGNSKQPILTLVNDNPAKSIVNGGFYFGKINDVTAPAPTVRIDGTFDEVSAANASGTTAAAFQTNCSEIPPSQSTSYLSDYVWCGQFIFNDNHIGSAQNVGLSTTYRRLPIADAFGPRGPGFASYYEADDETGLRSSLGGALVTTESDIFANGDDPGTFNDGGDRIDLHIGGGRYAGQGAPARIGHGITISSGDMGTLTPSFFGRALDVNSEWDTAGIDTSRGQPLVTVLPTAGDQGGPSSTLSFAGPIAGVTVGMIANGKNLPGTDTVTAVNLPAGSITLQNSSSSDIPSGTEITFTSSAPAIQVGTGQKMCFASNAQSCEAYVPGSGFNYKSPSGVVTSISDSGLLSAAGGLVATSPSQFSAVPYIDPNPGIVRDAKFGGSGVAWRGGAFGDSLTLQGHIANTGSSPTLTSCGPSPVISTTASDRHGTVAPGPGATTCTIGFAAQYGAVPDILLTSFAPNTGPYIIAVTAAGFQVGFATPGKFSYLVEQ